MSSADQTTAAAAQQVDTNTMLWLRTWHERLAHANLRACVVLGRNGDAGEVPDQLPQGPQENFAGLQPYLDALNCDHCRQAYGNPSGPSSW